MLSRVKVGTKQRFLPVVIFPVLVLRLNPAWALASAPDSVFLMVSETADVVQKFAAHEVREYLQQITGDHIGLGDDQAVHHIYVGQTPARAPARDVGKLRDELQTLAQDGFLIHSVGPDVVIPGKGSRGTLYGCYAFLERQGVRWFFPGKQYEVVPHHALNWHPRLEVS